MLFALVTLSFFLVIINVEAENQKEPSRELYEEFFGLVTTGLRWDDTLAQKAHRELHKGKPPKKEYQRVSLRRVFGTSPLTRGEEVLLTLMKLWTLASELRKVQTLRPGSEFGCSYAYDWNKTYDEYAVRVLCFFKNALKASQ